METTPINPPVVPPTNPVPMPDPQKKLPIGKTILVIFIIGIVGSLVGFHVVGVLIMMLCLVAWFGLYIFRTFQQILEQKKISILNANISILVVLTIVVYFLKRITGFSPFSLFSGTFFTDMAVIAYLVQAPILIAIAFFEAVRGFIKKVPTSSKEYLVTALLFLLIGFGACTLGVSGL